MLSSRSILFRQPRRFFGPTNHHHKQYLPWFQTIHHHSDETEHDDRHNNYRSVPCHSTIRAYSTLPSSSPPTKTKTLPLWLRPPPHPLHHHHQTRNMGRKSGASAFQPRPPTRKKLKAYHKRKREQQYQKVGRHSKHGSKAGVKREWQRDKWQELLDRAVEIEGGGGQSEGEGMIEGGDGGTRDGEMLDYDLGDAIVDDIIENTAHLTSSPTPQPRNIGHAHSHYCSIVSKRMQDYRDYLMEYPLPTTTTTAITTTEESQLPIPPPSPLPTDHQISSLLLSYRDSVHNSSSSSSSSQPLGLPAALSYLLSPPFSLSPATLPTFGPKTYTALLSCCASGVEGRRVLRLLRDNSHTPNAYHYSVLVDLYARVGDIRGADVALDEMRRLLPLSSEKAVADGSGVAGGGPTAAAYTSLMKGCYRVLRDGGRVGSAMKAEAGTLAWEKWKEMRIIGIDADVMAYGAIIRVMAARGLPERAINLLHELPVFNVKPTTFLYTSALRAVSRSHINALRFSNGSSPKNKRREEITKHHGNMCRQIVMEAEASGCDLEDEGFLSALMGCAGVAGDASTVKAIWLASRVRELAGLGEKELALLRGEEVEEEDQAIGMEMMEALGAGDVGDTRAVVSSSSSTTTKVAGTETSAMTTTTTTSPPALDSSSSSSPTTWQEREYGHDTRVLNALLYANARAMDIKHSLGNLWSSHSGDNRGYLCANSLRLLVARQKPKYKDKSIPGMTGTETGLSTMVWKDEDMDVQKMSKRERRRRLTFDQLDEGNSVDNIDEEFARIIGVDGEEYYGDEDEFDEDGDSKGNSDDDNNVDVAVDDYEEEENEEDLVIQRKYEKKAHLEYDSDTVNSFEIERDSGSNDDTDGNNVEDLFANVIDTTTEEGSLESTKLSEEESAFAEYEEKTSGPSDSGREEGLFTNVGDGFDDVDGNSLEFPFDKHGEGKPLDETQLDEALKKFLGDDYVEDEEDNNELDVIEVNEKREGGQNALVSADDYGSFQLEERGNNDDKQVAIPLPKDELEVLLDGFPLQRIRKVRKVMDSQLGKPSFLRLVPVLRENMPEVVSRVWLRKKNLRDADFVMEAAEERGVVDMHLLTSMLEVVANSGGVDKAIAFYQEEFAKKVLTPTAYCDRIILQMLIDKKRLGRALKFKNEIESQGKHLDLSAYGSLIAYFGNNAQLGSALMTLKECLSVHGSPPGEKSLTRVRILCRKLGIDEDEEVLKLMGRDPIEWLKEGEANRKREYSRRGRRQISFPANRLLQA